MSSIALRAPTAVKPLTQCDPIASKLNQQPLSGEFGPREPTRHDPITGELSTGRKSNVSDLIERKFPNDLSAHHNHGGRAIL